MCGLKKPLFNFIKLNCINADGLDIKKATLDGKFLSRLKKYFDIAVFPNFPEVNILCGSSNGGSYIAPALAMMNYHYQSGPYHCCIVRENAKTYGIKSDIIESGRHLTKNALVVHDFLDEKGVPDFINMCQRIKSIDYNIKGIIIIINSNESLSGRLKEQLGTHAVSIFNHSDFIK